MAEQKAVVVLSAKDKATPVLNKLSGTLKTTVVAGAAAAAIALGALTVELVQATKAANVQEEAEVKLAVALRSTGQASRATLDGLKAHASGLQAVTQFGDETILGVQALLIQLGRLTDTTEIERATEATLQFAAATGTDLKAAALLVAKAAQGQTASLSRYGLILKEDTPPQEKFNELLLLMEKNFGGTAEALGATFQGRFKQATNSFGDLQEQVGFTITRSEAAQTVLSLLASGFEKLGGKVEDNRDTLVRFVRDGILFAIEGFQLIARGAQTVADAAGIVAQTVQSTVGDISGFVGTALKFYGLGGEGALRFARNAEDATDAIANAQEGASQAFDFLIKKSEQLSLKIAETSGVSKDATDAILGLGEATGEVTEIDAEAIKAKEEKAKIEAGLIEETQRLQLEDTAFRRLKLQQEVADLVRTFGEKTEAIKEFEAAKTEAIEEAEEERAELEIERAEAKAEREVQEEERRIAALDREAEARQRVTDSIIATSGALVGQLAQAFGGEKKAVKISALVTRIQELIAAKRDFASGLTFAAPPPNPLFSPPAAAGLFLSSASHVAAAAFAGAAKFDAGGFVPMLPGASPNRDSVLAALTPGEFVVPKPFVSEMAELFNRGGRAGRFQDGGVVEPEGVPGAPGGVVNVTVMPTEPSTLGPLLDAMNEAVERLGFRLIASEVEA